MSTPFSFSITVSVLSFSAFVFVFAILKKRNLIQESQHVFLTNILTRVILPVMIFGQLASSILTIRHLELASSMFISGIACLCLAYVAGKLIGLKRPTLGALMISSAFGSSALLGYPLIKLTFPDNSAAFEDAIIVSELGVGLPLFILAPLIAMRFGNKMKEYSSVFHIIISYFKSPIFISIVLGFGVGFFHIPFKNAYLFPFKEIFDTITSSLTVFASLIIACQLKPIAIKKFIPLIAISAIIQMGIEPYICVLENKIFAFSLLDLNILVLLSSMPSAVIGTVFASEFDCDSEAASALTMANIVLSVIIVPLINIWLK